MHAVADVPLQEGLLSLKGLSFIESDEMIRFAKAPFLAHALLW
jgi:hypothetical protein